MASPSRAAALLLRRYEPAECGADGYPLAWRTSASPYLPRIPDLVRSIAGHRCERCKHPYLTRKVREKPLADVEGWSPCDRQCVHRGPVRLRSSVHLEPVAPLEVEGWNAGKLVAGGSGDVEAQWRVLTVHHLTGEKADCRWWNLAALCQRCHLYVQGRVRMDQVFPYEHTPWFKPHAAGYYAATYLGEELSRRQALEREEELLALERIA